MEDDATIGKRTCAGVKHKLRHSATSSAPHTRCLHIYTVEYRCGALLTWATRLGTPSKVIVPMVAGVAQKTRRDSIESGQLSDSTRCGVAMRVTVRPHHPLAQDGALSTRDIAQTVSGLLYSSCLL